MNFSFFILNVVYIVERDAHPFKSLGWEELRYRGKVVETNVSIFFFLLCLQ